MKTLYMPKDNLIKMLNLLEIKRNNTVRLDVWFKIGNRIRLIKKMIEKGMYVE